MLIKSDLYSVFGEALAVWRVARDFDQAETDKLSAYIVVHKAITAGKSGAEVLLVEIVPRSEGGAKSLAAGRYILKIDAVYEGRSDEEQRYNDFVSGAPEFAQKTVPALTASYRNSGHIVLLYQIALDELQHATTAEVLDFETQRLLCGHVSWALLARLNKHFRVVPVATAFEVLHKCLGHRLGSQRLITNSRTISNGRSWFPEGTNNLVDPVYFTNLSVVQSDTSVGLLEGYIHGDLHSGNLLLDRFDKQAVGFKLIDLGLARRGPLFFDYFYFELSLLRSHLKGATNERLLEILRHLADGSGTIPAIDKGILDVLTAGRESLQRWESAFAAGSKSTISRQKLLSQVAAGLNWSNKRNLSPEEVKLPYVYSAWAASQYIDRFHPDAWSEWRKTISTRDDIPSTTQLPTAQADANEETQKVYSEVISAVHNFDPDVAAYVLIAGSQEPTFATSIGMLPWALVIDLDPESENSGLYSTAVPTLKLSRSVKSMGLVPDTVNFGRGTAWLFAGGWPRLSEDAPATDREWRSKYRRRIRSLFTEFAQATNPKPIVALILPGQYLEQKRMDTIIEDLDEILQENADQKIVLLSKDLESPETFVQHYQLQPSSFLRNISKAYGSRLGSDLPTIPGFDERQYLSMEELRNVEEDMDVLHSNILWSNQQESRSNDSFWRGATPSWLDLHSGVDIERDVHTALMNELQEALHERRNRRINLFHHPGAGGSTAALRLAWSLRNANPTVILRRSSRYTAERIDGIFQKTGSAVFIVAEAHLIPTTAVDQLLVELAKRNARVVILYVARMLSPSPSAPIRATVNNAASLGGVADVRKSTEPGFFITDPLSASEAVRFAGAFKALTHNVTVKRRIERIATSDAMEVYRTPFFFGLTVFEESFTSLTAYVASHLKDISYGAYKIIKFLALVTAYSQVGLEAATISCILNLPLGHLLDISADLGYGPARIVIQVGRHVRLLHPLIAKEVLRQSLGGELWRDNLKDFALEFIHEIARIQGIDNDETMHLFSDIFIRRGYIVEEFSERSHPRFSELIEEMASAAEQHAILKELVEICPNESHFWNHLGRHSLYAMREYDSAESELTQAIELAPDDSLHSHTFGQVLRLRIERDLDDLFRAGSSPSAADVLQLVNPPARRAASAFEDVRGKQEGSSHGYITHIQMVLTIAENLLKPSGNSFSDLSLKKDDVGRWLTEQIPLAEELLRQAQVQRGNRDATTFEDSCLLRLTALYGNFIDVIKNWEVEIDSGRNDPSLRRVLASAYLASAKRKWSGVSIPQRRRVVELMKLNLTNDPSNEQDLRTWFQAYRGLPEFGFLEAMGQLQKWSIRASASPDSHFYLAILNFLLWYRSHNSGNEHEFRNEIEKCRPMARGQRGRSYEWLGREPSWCPLVQDVEMGDDSPQRRSFKHTDKLYWVEGIIDEINSPQQGRISIGGRLHAFFVPGRLFQRSLHLNKTVEFYLGFSYEGLRAWQVRLPILQSATREGVDEAITEEAKPAATGEVTSRASQINTGREDKILLPDVIRFITELVIRYENEQTSLWASNLEAYSRRQFGVSVHREFAFTTFVAFLVSIPGLYLEKQGPDFLVSPLP